MASKTRKKSSIDNTKVFKALLTLQSANLDRAPTIEDIAVPAGVNDTDKAALKQKFRLWSDPSIVIRTKDDDGNVTERQNKVLPQRRDFVNFMSAYLASRGVRSQNTVVEMCDKAYQKLRPTLTTLSAGSRSGIKLDGELGDLMDDLLGSELFEDEDENVVDGEFVDDEDLTAMDA